MKKKHYRYNLTELEQAALDSYAKWMIEDTQETRTNIFVTIKQLALAILEVGSFSKYGIDFEKTSYEYALYLFERIVLGSFRLVAKIDRFPLQNYIKKNIRHIIFSMKDDLSWHEIISDMEFLLDESTDMSDYEACQIENPEKELINKYHYQNNVIKILKIYYSIDEIKRLLAASLDLIFSTNYQYIPPDVPKDIRDFTMILICTAKRICRDNSIVFSTSAKKSDLKKAMSSAVRSTVFLSSVVDTAFFPKELLLSLDIDSLYRLCSVSGGQTIKIPTMRELDTMIGAVVSVSKMIMEGKTVDKALCESKNNYHLVFAHSVNIQSFISRLLQSYNVFNSDNPTDPLINMLVSSIKSLDTLFKHIEVKSKDSPTESLLHQYCDLSESFSKFTDSLVKISSAVKGEENVDKQ